MRASRRRMGPRQESRCSVRPSGRKAGHTVLEYAIIIAMIAISLVAVYAYFHKATSGFAGQAERGADVP